MSWIPVEERLPEDGAFMWTTTRSGSTVIASYNSDTGEWIDYSRGERDVIAWQERPAPYVKPRRFVVVEVDDSLSLCPCYVRDTKTGMVVSADIPTREAAEKIADIYEEAYRGE